jgi:hypothetical protein
MNPLLEVRRAAGEFALLLAGIYLLFLVAMAVGVFRDHTVPLSRGLLLLLPAVAFAPSVKDAIRLHRTENPDLTRKLWRRYVLLALAGSTVGALELVVSRDWQ